MDNMGGVFAKSRHYSRLPPTSFILMEICLLQQVHNVFTTPCHVPRAENAWADELTHLQTAEWDSSKRHIVDHSALLVLHKLLASSLNLPSP